MPNPTFTRKSSDSLVLMRVGIETPDEDHVVHTNAAADDDHLTIGRGDRRAGQPYRHYIGRAEIAIPEATWPAAGRLVKAVLTVRESPTDSHSAWRGGSPRIAIYRMTAKPGLYAPAGYDGHGEHDYSAAGSGDHYPGSAVATLALEMNVSGVASKDVSSMLEEMLPARILRRDGETACGDALYGYFQLRSSDEEEDARSMVLSRSVTLSVEIDTRVTPGTPTILEVVGAVEDGGTDPTLVATADGRQLGVRFAFAAGAGDSAATAELELYGTGASDATPGTRIKTTWKRAPTRAVGTNTYTITLAGLPLSTEGRFRLQVTSSAGKASPWTSLDDDAAHVRLVVIPPAPVGILVESTTEDPDVTASLASSHPGTITGMQVKMTMLPGGIISDTGEVDIGGALRTATVPVSGANLTNGQQTSTVVRLRDDDQLWGRWSAPVKQTHHKPAAATEPEITTTSQRFLSLRPTFTITASTFDGYRLKLLHETDDAITIYDSGTITVVNQTSVSPQVAAGRLTYGEKFRAIAAVVPDGEVTLTAYTEPKPYSIASLPASVLSVPDALRGRVQTQTPTWRRTITDPDGGTIVSTVLEVNTAATPQGTGTRITKFVGSPGTTDVEVPSLTMPWETSVDARLWARNDITALVGTTAVSGGGAGSTALTVTSTAGMVAGQRFIIYSATAGRSEERPIATLPGGNVITFTTPFEWTHLADEVVAVYAPGPFSSWLTITAMQPPTVDLLSPGAGATITRPWEALVWETTAYNGRTQASAVAIIRDAAGQGIVGLSLADETTVDIPAFLLADDTTYGWDVTVTDSEGMVTTSATRTFTTSFTELDPVVSVTALADPTVSGVVVSWEPITDPDLHHFEVTWYDDAGAPVRIDGGPEELLDERPVLTETRIMHVGARLGDNTYSVVAHNGWRPSEPVNASETLTWSDIGRGSWEIVDTDGAVLSLSTGSASIPTEAIIDPQQPVGSAGRALAWGIASRRVSMQITYVPSEDGSLVTTLRQLMADPTRARPAQSVWIKPAPGYLLDPLWVALTSFVPTPGNSGLVDVTLDWLEVADPVHSIPPLTPPPADTGDPEIYALEGEFVWDTVEVEA